MPMANRIAPGSASSNCVALVMMMAPFAIISRARIAVFSPPSRRRSESMPPPMRIAEVNTE